ncbi:hypothetical protein NLJ89_g11414 [Agrocybe chaxingu]|uniref:HAT C-terminal dimerisation domain-containing protein n=1 Tax=Agrocybe chaxingu TaxID=84603 RepID=A0A9W8JQ03_9AGAR|nr:hypothetical protein NLJ89_g11414 [Agrocybe chaxingu]
MPPKIIREGDNVKYIFVCRAHPSIEISRARHDEATSNLNRHAQRCAPANNAQTKAMAAFAQGSSYTPEKHRLKLALWVTRKNRPFSIVEDEDLLDIFHDLNAACVTPGRRTITRDIKEIHVIGRGQLGELLRRYPGKIHVAADGWCSPNVIAFIGLTAHWIIDGRMASTILDFIKATKAHTGEYLAARIAESIRGYGLQDKILGFVADNASNNDTLVTELGRLLPSFGGKKVRVRCFAHILNLVVKAVLSQFSRKMIEEDNTLTEQLDMLEEELNNGTGFGDEEPELESDDDEVADDVVRSDNAAIRDVIDEVSLSGRLTPLSRDDANVARVSIAKLRTLANKIVNSPTIREDLAQCCKQVNIEAKLMVRDVATRWNSTAALVKRAIDLEPALQILVVMSEHNKPRGVRLSRFRLSGDEWKILKQLSPLLNIFTYATELISNSKIPLIHQVIPVFDTVTAALDESIDNEANELAVRHAALRGMLILNKYYALTDDAVVYRIAMILHHRHKTAYFIKAGWLESWIETAKDLARKEWVENYKPRRVATLPSTNEGQRVRDRDLDAAKKFFASKMQDEALSDVDEFEDWLSTGVVKTHMEPIPFWEGMQAARNPLARMALDYLSIPATSTDVERSFSKGGLTVSRFRHALSDESTQAATLVGTWADLDGVLPRDKILQVFKDKKKRPKKKVRVEGPSQDDSEVIILE